MFIFYLFCLQAHADHFDLVSRRMGFIPLPLGSLVSSGSVYDKRLDHREPRLMV